MVAMGETDRCTIEAEGLLGPLKPGASSVAFDMKSCRVVKDVNAPLVAPGSARPDAEVSRGSFVFVRSFLVSFHLIINTMSLTLSFFDCAGCVECQCPKLGVENVKLVWPTNDDCDRVFFKFRGFEGAPNKYERMATQSEQQVRDAWRLPRSVVPRRHSANAQPRHADEL